MAAVLIQGPAIEPLSLADAKLFLRFEHADDDKRWNAMTFTRSRSSALRFCG
jgi:hypothetical protein